MIETIIATSILCDMPLRLDLFFLHILSSVLCSPFPFREKSSNEPHPFPDTSQRRFSSLVR